MLKNIKSCGTHFLHQHVAAETAAAAQSVVHEQTEHSDACVDSTAVSQAAAREALEEGLDRDLLRLSNCSTPQSPGDARVFNVHYHTAYASGQPAVHSVKIGMQRGVHMCSCLQLAHRGLPCRHYFAVLLHDQSLCSLMSLSSIPAGLHRALLAAWSVPLQKRPVARQWILSV